MQSGGEAAVWALFWQVALPTLEDSLAFLLAAGCPIPLLFQKKGLESYEKEAEKRGFPQALPEAPLLRERGEVLITQKGRGRQRRESIFGGRGIILRMHHAL